MLKLTWDQIVHEPGALFTIMVAFGIGFLASRKGNPAVKIGLLALAVMHLLYRDATLLGKFWMWALIFGFGTHQLGLHYLVSRLTNGIRERLRDGATREIDSREETRTSSGQQYYEQSNSNGRDAAYQQSQAEFARRKAQREESTKKRGEEKKERAKGRDKQSKSQEKTEDFFRNFWEKDTGKKTEQKPPPEQEKKTSPPPKDKPPKSPPSPRNRNWWEVLGVSSTATLAEIKKAYRTISMETHPDTYHGTDEKEKQRREEEFKKVNSAFETAKRRRK